MVEESRPRGSTGLRIIGVVVLALLGWLLFGSIVTGALRATIALIGYVIVGFAAYHIGKFVGRHHHAD
jgi:hypothetical protein